MESSSLSRSWISLYALLEQARELIRRENKLEFKEALHDDKRARKVSCTSYSVFLLSQLGLLGEVLVRWDLACASYKRAVCAQQKLLRFQNPNTVL